MSSLALDEINELVKTLGDEFIDNWLTYILDEDIVETSDDVMRLYIQWLQEYREARP